MTDDGIPLLTVKNLGKLYSRSVVNTRKRLGNAALRTLFYLKPKTYENDIKGNFWAVDNVSFELQRGNALGIIGLNGSGKTTTLRMLAGQILPDAGSININGTSAAMIDLQAGFRNSASGYENIFLRAAALGFTKKQTRAHIDEIVDFSELGKAIQAPIGTYSSGMRMRLAFSTMMIVSPDLLIIDEVLAVGDFRFRQKCLGKIREMRDRSAFVFVSHSMGDIANFCDHVIVMHQGKIFYAGSPKDAINEYEKLEKTTEYKSTNKKIDRAIGPKLVNSEVVSEVTHTWRDLGGKEITSIDFAQPFELHVSFRPLIKLKKLSIGVPIWAHNTHYTTGLSTKINSGSIVPKTNQMNHVRLRVEGGFINPGTLKSMLAITEGPEHIYRNENPDLIIKNPQHPTWGAMTVPHKWRQVEK